MSYSMSYSCRHRIARQIIPTQYLYTPILLMNQHLLGRHCSGERSLRHKGNRVSSYWFTVSLFC